MQGKVSVIVPVYNVEKYLERCINSILGQTYENLELILVDDGSTDRSPDICDQYKVDTRVKVLHKVNEGAGEARNKGISMATGEFLTFVDSDDYIAAGFLEKLMGVATKDECDIVQCGFLFGGEETYSFAEEQKEDKPVLIFDNHTVFDTRKAKIIICAKLYRKSLFQDIWYPKVSVHDDEFITYKLLYQAKKIGIIETPYYYYYESPNSIMRTKKNYYPDNFIQAYDERIEFFKMRNEEDLVLISYREKCIRLMLFYFQCFAEKDNENDKDAILDMFKREYKVACKRRIPPREKVLLEIFYRFPKISARMMRILR